ncbi:VQ motif-containing protein 1-like [Trifolium pratense]|uniref:VQ motif-containing protein 1-like n=1 Tax=Trifolium pratense TaxID=57577 RepID=UPI001E697A07|nr:VQ motif-containing protein 1-like [Trifolium pratense]
MRRNNSAELGPKIVQIETRYVQTDAGNFRDVVQSLTGKNSSTDWIGRGTYGSAAAAEIKGGNIKAEEVVIGASSTTSNKMMMSNMSFKEFESLLFELPAIQIDEMVWS